MYRLLCVIFLISCFGNASDWETHGAKVQPAASNLTSKKMVEGKVDCLKWDDSDCRPWSRITDDLMQVGVHLLISPDRMACEVTDAESVMVMPSTEYECVWRAARP